MGNNIGKVHFARFDRGFHKSVGRPSPRSLVGAVKCTDSMKADIDLDIGQKTFTSGLLPELVAVLRRSRPGDLVAVIGDEQDIGPELETWCRFTGNPLLEATVEKGGARWVFRCGTLAVPAEDNRPVGARKACERCPVIELSCKSVWTALRQNCTTSIAGPAHGRAHAKVFSALVRMVFECDWRPRFRPMPRLRRSVNSSMRRRLPQKTE